MHILDELSWRGLIHQQTSEAELRQHLGQPRVAYCGFDPTASSLTVGNLVAVLMLVRMQRAGHTPIVVMGGATGLIGDPSGKSAERPLLTPVQVQENIDGQRPIFERLLDFEGSHSARIVNNADWFSSMGFLEALRDLGKHFSVNMMIQRDSVRERLHSREQGISYTEFSYMLLQAYDFLHLHENHGCTLQVAGSDQWGNLVAGIDLIRRVRRTETFGLTAPLITKADGSKFGKSEAGAIWLTADRTSPYAFYQFWLNSADADLPKYLRMLTLLDRATVDELLAEHERDPGRRTAHQALAAHLTELLHGPAGLAQAKEATSALFSGNVAGLPPEVIREVFENAPSTTLPKAQLEAEGAPLVDLLVAANVTKSKRESRELLSAGAILVNGQRLEPGSNLTTGHLLHGETLLIRRGKKHWHVVKMH